MAVFIIISETFILSNSKDKDLAPQYKQPIVARFKKIKVDTLCLSLKDDYKSVGGVSFKCGPQNKVTGDLLIDINGKNIEIKCDAIFKINIRPQHKENFLSNKGTWTFNRLQQGEYGDDLIGDVSKGLDVKKYKLKLRSGTEDMSTAVMQNVKTGSKKTDLK